MRRFPAVIQCSTPPGSEVNQRVRSTPRPTRRSDRVTWTIESLVAEHHQETVLVVTHSGPIAIVQAMALDLDFTDATQRRSLPELGNCELLSVATDGRFRLLDNDGGA